MATPTRPKPRWIITALGTVLGATIGGMALMTNVMAVDGGTFELDGNVKDDSGNTQIDWQNVFGLTSVTPPQTGTPVDTSPDKAFIHDVPTGSPAKETMYDAGKDIQDTTQWTRKSVTKVVPDKDNILDAFAVQTVANNGDKIVYFGADRLANNGDAALSFWFFRSPLSESGTNGFAPGHTARHMENGTLVRGDILVQVDFLNGGGESRLRVFEWVGSGGSDGSLDLLRPAADVNGNTVCLDDDTACATTNNVGGVDSYWPYTPKAGPINKFPAESIFEGGINITRLVGDGCFNTFLASTRSSQQVTSDLKDLAMGEFNTCGSIDLVSKACNMPAGTTLPAYNDTTGKYTTFHDITIRNNGGGSKIFDVQVRDDSIGGTWETTCKIVAITGGAAGDSLVTVPAGGSIALPDNQTFVTVANNLSAGVDNQLVVRVSCDSKENPLHNAASIRGAQVSGGNKSLTDNVLPESDDTMPANCVFDAAPSLQLSKTCTGPVDKLVKEDGVWKAHVCADITLTNNSNPKQTIDLDVWIDEHNDGSSTNILDKKFGASTYALAPDASVSYQDCYNATIFDQDGDGEVVPSQITYGDTASASGVGRASGTAEVLDISDKCPLCPPTSTSD